MNRKIIMNPVLDVLRTDLTNLFTKHDFNSTIYSPVIRFQIGNQTLLKGKFQYLFCLRILKYSRFLHSRQLRIVSITDQLLNDDIEIRIRYQLFLNNLVTHEGVFLYLVHQELVLRHSMVWIHPKPHFLPEILQKPQLMEY